MNVSDTEAAQHEQTVVEAKLTPEQRTQARDILHPVTDGSADLVRAQECAWRIEEAEAPNSPMGEYCRLMLGFSPDERLLVVQGAPNDSPRAADILRATTLRIKLLSYAKPRRGSPWS